MPRRRTLHLTAHQPEVKPADTIPAPFLARVPLVQPALMHFFHNQLSCNHRHYLIQKILETKQAENQATLERLATVNNLIARLHLYARLNRPFVQRAALGHHARLSTETPNLVTETPTSLPWLVSLVTLSLLIDAAVMMKLIDESWWIGVAPEKDYSSSLAPSSPFACFMLSITMLTLYATAAAAFECQDSIDVQASLTRLTAELASLKFYPEDELKAIEARYHHHRTHCDAQDVAALSLLLKQLHTLQKTPTLSAQKQTRLMTNR